MTTISLQTSGSVIRTTVNVRISCACFDATSKTQLNNTFHIITLQVLVFGKSLHGPSSRHAYGPLKEARVYSENNTIDDTPYEKYDLLQRDQENTANYRKSDTQGGGP